MGVSTVAIGFLPSFSSIRLVAPYLLVVLRSIQGLALGGEYAGTAIYVAESVPLERRGVSTVYI